MAATWLTSCKRAKGIREAAAREGGGGSVSVCVSKFLAKMKSMQAPRHSVPKTIAPANEIKQDTVRPSRDH